MENPVLPPSSRSRNWRHAPRNNPAPSRSRSRTRTSRRSPVRVVAAYLRPPSVSCDARSTVNGNPDFSSAEATSRPFGRVVGVPRAYRAIRPRLQPSRADSARAATVIPPATMLAMKMAITRPPLAIAHRVLSTRRATVINAIVPASTAFSGMVLVASGRPVSAVSICADSTC